MLRLHPTQLKLEKRDLDWHIPRHEERQALRATIPSSNINQRSPRKPRNARFPGAEPSSGRALSSKHAKIHNGPDTEIFSDDPVPRGSRAFWDKALAEAGTPTRIQTVNLARGTIVEPSNSFLDSAHSSRGSIEAVSIGADNSSTDLRSPSFDAVIGHSSAEAPSTSTSDSSNPTENAQVNMAGVEQTPPVQPISSRSRLSFFGFRRKAQPDNDGSSAEHGYLDHRLSGSMAVDGPSDRNSSHYRGRSESSGEGMGADIDDGLYGDRRDRRTISQTFSSHGDAQAPNAGPSAIDLPYRSLMSPPRAIGHLRNVSGSLPRSSLHISQAAASSSPERRSGTPTSHDSNGFERQGLLSQPPRRRRMYRPRSRTYSFAESDGSPNQDVPQMDGPSTMQAITGGLPSLHVSQPPMYSGSSPGGQLSGNHMVTSPGVLSDTYLPSSPPEMPDSYIQGMHRSLYSPNSNVSATPPQDAIEIRSYRSHSSMLSSHSHLTPAHGRITSSPNPALNSQRSLSPFAAPFVPSSASRNISPQLALPPPFSATSRNVSSSNAYPPSSPASPHTPPQRQVSISTSPTNNQQYLRIPVYNDNVDPSLQPQTPAGLPRNGVLATQNPFRTGPIRTLGRSRALAGWQSFATPTRRPSRRSRNNRGPGVTVIDQENVGAIPEEERRIRRELAMGGTAR